MTFKNVKKVVGGLRGHKILVFKTLVFKTLGFSHKYPFFSHFWGTKIFKTKILPPLTTLTTFFTLFKVILDVEGG